MADKIGWWEYTKDWTRWTVRDEIYGYMRMYWGRAMVTLILAVGGGIFTYAKSYPTLSACFVTAAVLLLIIMGLAKWNARASASKGAPETVPQSSTSPLIPVHIKEFSSAEWPPLTSEQKARLIEAFRRQLSGKEVQITHNGMPDAARLAADLAEVLMRSGTTLVAPVAEDRNPVPAGIWICVAGGDTDEIGAPLAIGMRAVKLCQPDIVAPVASWACVRIGQKARRQFPWES